MYQNYLDNISPLWRSVAIQSTQTQHNYITSAKVILRLCLPLPFGFALNMSLWSFRKPNDKELNCSMQVIVIYTAKRKYLEEPKGIVDYNGL